MACGEYISVASQRDSEEADIAKEVAEQQKGEQARLLELEELTMIYVNRGLTRELAEQVCVCIDLHVRIHKDRVCYMHIIFL